MCRQKNKTLIESKDDLKKYISLPKICKLSIKFFYKIRLIIIITGEGILIRYDCNTNQN